MFLVDEMDKNLKADIRVIGVGGGGNNAVETMIKASIQGVKFIAVNTDAQALGSSSAEVKIQLGEKLTKGLGAGANPEIGRRAAMESYEEIVEKLKGADMVFVTAGMGGGTGSGGAPVIAEVAKELGILTVGIVTYPFLFEGNRRKKYADTSIFELKKYVDTLITIPNEKLLSISDKNTPLLQSFKKTDEILLQAVKGIAELVSVKGLINLDFADVKTVMSDKGMALMSIGMGEGPNRAIEAVSQAIESPLLGDVSIKGSKGMIVNITAGNNLSLMEVNQATSCLTKIVDSDADIIVGAVIDESMGESLSITLIATGFEGNSSVEADRVNSLSKNLKAQAFFEQNKELNLIEEKPTSYDEGDLDKETQSASEIEVKKSPIEEEPPASFSDEGDLDKETQSASKIEVKESPIEEEPPASFSDEGDLDKETQSASEIEVKKSPIEEEPPASFSNSSPMTLREKLLLKAKEYTKSEKPSFSSSHQMSMDWEEKFKEEDESLNDISASPFESSIDFFDEDMG